MKNTLYVIPCDVGRCHDFVCTGVLDVVAMSPAYVSARILEDVFQRVARRPNIRIEGLSILPRCAQLRSPCIVIRLSFCLFIQFSVVVHISDCHFGGCA